MQQRNSLTFNMIIPKKRNDNGRIIHVDMLQFSTKENEKSFGVNFWKLIGVK